MTFNSLPIELNEKIAFYLHNDQHLCAFTLICQQTNQAVRHFRSGVWRKRFSSCYDLPPGKTGSQIKSKYQARQRSLRKDIHFKSGHKAEEQEQLKAIRQVILESFVDTAQEDARPYSKNMNQLRYFTRRSNILQCVLQHSPKAHELLQIIQLLFFPWSLDMAMNYPTINFPASQQVVYSHPEEIQLFRDKHKIRVNISFLLHVTNFFKYHMTQQQEATLFVPFQDLEDGEKPKVWQSKLEQGIQKLGKLWKGSYGKLYCRLADGLGEDFSHSDVAAYLHDLRDVPIIRSLEANNHVIIDSIDHYGEGFQTLQLDFSSEKCTPWPAIFDEHLQSLPTPQLLKNLGKHSATIRKAATSYPSPPPKPKAKAKVKAKVDSVKPQPELDYLQFSGTGIDADPFFCTGIIHALPPQQGIPGFQRITMMKIFSLDMPSVPSSQPASASSSNDTFSSSAASTVPAVIDESCWAYEGVVLPGGMTILGRWWSPADETGDRLGTGPFIFWNVEDD